MPFPNEHAARVANPDNFVRIVQLQELPNGIRILGGPLKSDPQGSGKPQSYRFPRTKFTASEARTWLSEHDIKVQLFEKATGETKNMYENFLPQYIANVSKDSAEINLFDEVGNGGISGQAFADEIQLLNEFGAKEIHININSPGGTIIDGLSIFHAINNSEAETHTHIVGIAASMAGIFALAGDHTTIVDFGKVMLHDPLITKDGKKVEDLTPEQEDALGAMRSTLLVILKNRTNKSESELSEMMAAQTWLNAKEALKGGFVDEIISSKHKDKKRKRQPVAEITNILQSITNTSKTEKMKELCKYLNLSEDATEASIIEAIKKINDKLTDAVTNLETRTTELTEATDKITAHETTIKAFEDKQTEMTEALVNETVDKAQEDGVISEDKVEEIKNHYKNDPVGLKLIFGNLKTPAQIISDKLEAEGGNKEIAEDRKDWSFRKWEQEDATGLEDIRNNNVKLYNKMYEAEYDVKLETA